MRYSVEKLPISTMWAAFTQAHMANSAPLPPQMQCGLKSDAYILRPFRDHAAYPALYSWTPKADILSFANSAAFVVQN